MLALVFTLTLISALPSHGLPTTCRPTEGQALHAAGSPLPLPPPAAPATLARLAAHTLALYATPSVALYALPSSTPLTPPPPIAALLSPASPAHFLFAPPDGATAAVWAQADPPFLATVDATPPHAATLVDSYASTGTLLDVAFASPAADAVVALHRTPAGDLVRVVYARSLVDGSITSTPTSSTLVVAAVPPAAFAAFLALDADADAILDHVVAVADLGLFWFPSGGPTLGTPIPPTPATDGLTHAAAASLSPTVPRPPAQHLVLGSSSAGTLYTLHALGPGSFASPVPLFSDLDHGPAGQLAGFDSLATVPVREGSVDGIFVALASTPRLVWTSPLTLPVSPAASLAFAAARGTALVPGLAASSLVFAADGLLFDLPTRLLTTVWAAAFEIETTLNNPQSIEAADIDGDGYDDLVVAALDADALVWYRNLDGTGAFGSRTNIATGADADAVDLALPLDVQGDGAMDVVVIGSSLAWFDNTAGNGSLWTRMVIDDSTSGLISFAIVSLNGDAVLDLIATVDAASDGYVTYLGTGSGFDAGTFVALSACTGPRRVVVADMTDDAVADLVLNCATSDTIVKANGNGALTSPFFGADAMYEPVSNIATVAVVDLNGDGLNDIVTAGGGGAAGKVWGLMNLGLGALDSAFVLATVNSKPSEILPYDINADGLVDLVYPWPSAYHSGVGVALQDGAGGWFSTNEGPVPAAINPVFNSGASSATLIDIDNTGIMSIAYTRDGVDSVAVALAQPVALAYEQRWLDPVYNDAAAAIVHFSAEPSVFFTHAYRAYVMPLDVVGNPGAAVELPGSSACSPTVVDATDVDGDGDTDAVVICVNSGFKSLGWWANNGSGAFLTPISPFAASAPDGIPTAFAFGRINSAAPPDVAPDVAVAYESTETVLWFANNGAGVFSFGSTLDSGVTSLMTVAIVDIDGDLCADVVSGGRDVLWWLNDCFGNFGARRVAANTVVTVSTHAVSIFVGDMNADTTADVVVLMDDYGVYIVPNNGDTTFAPTVPIYADHGTLESLASIAVADLDDDGDNDIVAVGDHSRAMVTLWLNTGLGTFDTPLRIGSVTSALRARGLAIGDATSDGVLDVIATSNEGMHMFAGMTSLYPLVESTTTVSCLSMHCVESAIFASSLCKVTTITLLPSIITSCFSEAHHTLNARTVILKAAVPGSVVIDCGVSSRTALFEVTNGASLTLDGISVRGGWSTGLSYSARQGLFRVVGASSTLTLANAVFGPDIRGGIAAAIGGGTAVLRNLVVHGAVLARPAVTASTPAWEVARVGGAVARVHGVASSLLVTNVTAVGCGVAPDVSNGVGGVFLIEDSSALLDAVTVDSVVGDVYIGGAVCALGPTGSVTITSSSFTSSSASFGGALAVVGDDSVLGTPVPSSEASASHIVLPLTLTPTPALVVSVSDTSFASVSAVYGNGVAVCGGRLDGPGSVDGADGAFGWVCHGASLSPTPYTSAAEHPWLSGAVAAGGVGWTSNWVSLEWSDPPLTTIMSGVRFSPLPSVVVRDVFGAVVVDAAVSLVTTVTGGPDAVVANAVRDEPLAATPLSVFAASTGAVASEAGVGTFLSLSVAPATDSPWTTQLPGMVLAPAAVELVPCGVGYGRATDVAVTAGIVCAPCSPGSVSAVKSLDECVADFLCALPAIKVTDEVCVLCPTGTEFSHGAFASGLANGTIPAAPSSEEASVACLCSAGLWWPAGRDPTTPCAACPTGGVCPGGGPDVRPLAAPGFFDVGDGSPKFAACPRTSSCAGGARGTSCARGANGYMCATCDAGWYPARSGAGDGGECRKCGASSISLLVVGLGALFASVVATVVLGARGRRRGRRAEAEHTEAVSRDHARHPTGLMPRALSAAVLYVQVLVLLGTSALSWPSSVSSTMNQASFASLDVGSIVTSCELGSFYTAYAVSVAIPFVLLAVAAGMSLVMVGPRGCGDHFVRVVITLGPLLYIPMTKAVLQVFDCTQLPNGKFYLDAALEHECGTGEWVQYAAVGMVGVAGVTVGLPAFVFVLLVRNRDSLFEPAVMARIGSVYQALKARFWFAEVGLLVERVALVCIALFLSRMQIWQLAMMLAVFLVHAGWVLRTQPFFEAIHNTLHVRLYLALSAVLFLGFTFHADRFPNDWSRWVCEILVFGVMALGLVFIGITAVAEMRAKRATSKTATHPMRRRATEKFIRDLAEYVSDEDEVADVMHALLLARMPGSKSSSSSESGGNEYLYRSASGDEVELAGAGATTPATPVSAPSSDNAPAPAARIAPASAPVGRTRSSRRGRRVTPAANP